MRNIERADKNNEKSRREKKNNNIRINHYEKIRMMIIGQREREEGRRIFRITNLKMTNRNLYKKKKRTNKLFLDFLF
jgi:hypothetical protein